MATPHDVTFVNPVVRLALQCRHRPRALRRGVVVLGAALVLGCLSRADDSPALRAEVARGQRLFDDERFSRPRDASDGEPVSGGARAPVVVSCRTCHFVDAAGAAGERRAAFADFAVRSPVVPRADGHTTTPRNSPSLVDALPEPGEPGLLHFDAEFASAESLVKETWLGRNFGWLPGERVIALRRVVSVLRGDRGVGGAESSQMNDEELADAAARAVVAFLRTLRFSRDERGHHNGSPYDVFLGLNRLPRAPGPDQTAIDYGRRIGESTAALRAPRFVDEPARAFRFHDQPFKFGELELQGMRIFFRGAVGTAQTRGAGNCAECHVPPRFSDFKFHNTGAAQDDYDAIHGAGAFAVLIVPSLTEREADYERWLPPTERHPAAQGSFLFPPAVETPARADLGLWNVYRNPDLPVSQRALERVVNPAGQRSADEVLARALGQFKTSGLRDLGQSAPFLHTGQMRSIEDVILFYQRMSDLARAGRMRNAPAEFFSMRLAADDVAPLAAFLRALNEDYDGHAPRATAP